MVKTAKHACKTCSHTEFNKKTMVKHEKRQHPVKKAKTMSTKNKLVFCPELGCSWTSRNGNLSKHLKGVHQRTF